MGGHTRSYGVGDWDYYFVKLDPDQQVEWTRTVGGPGVDNCFAVRKSPDGGYLAAGHTNSFGMGNYDFYVVKLDADGEVLWTRTVGGPEGEFAFSMAVTEDGGCAITGATHSFGMGNYDVYVVKLDPEGELEWTRTIGGPAHDEGRSIWQTTDGGYVIAGKTASFGAGGDDLYVLKLDSQGEVQWTRTVGGSNADRGYGVQQTEDGGYVVAGLTASYGAGGNDVYVVRLDPDGELLWTKTIGRLGQDEGMSVQQTSDLGFVIAGSTTSFSAGVRNIYTVKLDADGNLEWARGTLHSAGVDFAFHVHQDETGGYVVGGYSQVQGPSDYDMYLMKLDANGEGCIWSAAGGTVSSGGVSGSGGMTDEGGEIGEGGTVDSGGTITMLCSTTGIADASNDPGTAISPKPASDRFIITGIQMATVTVCDVLGQRVAGMHDVHGPVELNASSWPCGAYFVQLIEQDGRRSVHKVLVER